MKSYEILEKLSNEDTLVISLITGEKRPLELFATQIALDILPIFYDIFEETGRKKIIKLVLRSNGGVLDAPLPIVNLIREYCDNFNIYVPENAHSAGTLIALGADKIFMSPFGSLSPIDPQINIEDRKGENKSKISFSVEDVAGYYNLIDKLGITDEGKIKALEFITQKISPTLLGQIERVRNLIKIIANKIIKNDTIDETKRQLIIKMLVEEIPSHNYRISRKEAKELGLPVENENDKDHTLLRDLLKEYKDKMGENEGELIIDIPDEQDTIEKIYSRGIIETNTVTYDFQTKYIFHRNGKVNKSINEWRKTR